MRDRKTRMPSRLPPETADEELDFSRRRFLWQALLATGGTVIVGCAEDAPNRPSHPDDGGAAMEPPRQREDGAGQDREQRPEGGDGPMAPSDPYGAGTAYLGSPIGGGPGYASFAGGHPNGSTTNIYTQSMMRSGIDHVATTTSEFLAALSSAVSGDVIFIPSDVTIDLTDKYGLTCASGVTIASDRGNGASQGGRLYRSRIYTSESDTYAHTFRIESDKVRFTGLRIQGGDSAQDLCIDVQDENCGGIVANFPQSVYSGVTIRGDDCEVDNCELYDWSWRAIAYVYGKRGLVHHCYIHHCHTRGYGYGVAAESGEFTAEGCIFDHTRHATAATGVPEDSYVCRYNIHLNHGDAYGGHHFDVHGNSGGAGGTTSFHHNTVEVGDGVLVAFGIRACPYVLCEIYNNDIKSGDCGFDRCSSGSGIKIWNNRVSGAVTDEYLLSHE